MDIPNNILKSPKKPVSKMKVILSVFLVISLITNFVLGYFYLNLKNTVDVNSAQNANLQVASFDYGQPTSYALTYYTNTIFDAHGNTSYPVIYDAHGNSSYPVGTTAQQQYLSGDLGSGLTPAQQMQQGNPQPTIVTNPSAYISSGPNFQSGFSCSDKYLKTADKRFVQIAPHTLGRTQPADTTDAHYLDEFPNASAIVDNIKDLESIIGANLQTVYFCVPENFPQNILVFSYCENSDCNNPLKYGVYKSAQKQVVGNFDTKYNEFSTCDYPIGITAFPEDMFYFQCQSNTTGNRMFMETYKADMINNKVTKIAELENSKLY